MECGVGRDFIIESSGTLPAMTKATYYFRFYLARAVEHAGMGDRYLSLLQLWHEMVALGLTTWAEQPDQLVTEPRTTFQLNRSRRQCVSKSKRRIRWANAP